MIHASTFRRRLRFSLRTLLVLVAACAVGTWFYLTGWPWLVSCWEQYRLERAVRQLKVGTTTYDEWMLLPEGPRRGTEYTANSDRILTGTTRYFLKNAVYFVHLRYPQGFQGGMMQCRSTSVEVFRLPPVPLGYTANRKLRNDPLLDHTSPPGPGESADKAYADDFFQFVNSDRTDDFGLKAELIYSDSPTHPPAGGVRNP